MEPSESNSLIVEGISRIRTFNRKACVYSCIVVLTIAICTLLLIIAAQRNSNVSDDISGQLLKNSNMETIETNHSKLQYLVDMLPESFAMTLRVFQKQAENWIPQDNQEILVEFNRYGRELRYRECYILANNKSGVETYNLGDCVIVAEGQSVFRISGESDWKCFPHVESLSVYYIIQLGLNATPTYSKYIETCHGREWKVEMQDSDIVFCENAGQLLTIYQNIMKADVIHWTSPATDHIKVPNSLEECTFKTVALSALFDSKKVTPIFKTASRKSRKQVKDCLFVHGSGQTPETEPLTGYEILSEYESYLGNISNYTPQCKTRKFIRMNTIVHGWDNSTLHEQFCEFAAGKEKLVSEKIIFSHSMGNLIMAAALYRNTCSFENNSTEWYSIAGPWKGSNAVDRFRKLCPIFHKRLVKYGLNTYCTDDGKEPNTAYASMRTDYVSHTGITYTDMINISKGLLKGVMCGDSPLGLRKRWKVSIMLEFVQLLTGDGKLSDGLVSLDECSAVGGTFQETPEIQFYRGGFNHLEATCIYGDTSWTVFGDSNKLQPCKWISLR